MYERAGKGLNQTNGGSVESIQTEDSRLLEQPRSTYSEIADIFPALQKYKDEHNATNLKKLCVEIVEFCRSVYASTESEQERKIYNAMLLEKLNN